MKTLTLPLLIIAMLFATTAHADWGKMLEDFKAAGKTMLGQESVTDGLSNETMIDGLREALEVGSRRAINAVGQDGGYLNNP